MQFGYGTIQTLCTARAQHGHSARTTHIMPPWRPRLCCHISALPSGPHSQYVAIPTSFPVSAFSKALLFKFDIMGRGKLGKCEIWNSEIWCREDLAPILRGHPGTASALHAHCALLFRPSSPGRGPKHTPSKRPYITLALGARPTLDLERRRGYGILGFLPSFTHFHPFPPFFAHFDHIHSFLG